MSSYFIATILLFLLVSHSSGNVEQENAKKYMTIVVRRMVSIIESNPISGDAFPMRDFENNFNVTKYGLQAIGTVRFHSGFIARFGSALLTSSSHRNRITDTASIITASFKFTLVQTVYDTRYNLKDFTGTGAFTLLFTDVVYSIELRRRHADGGVSGKIVWDKLNETPGPISSPFYTIAKSYPDNGYTQLISQEMKHKAVLQQELRDSFVDWVGVTLQPALDMAVNENANEFPPIIYYENN